MNPESFAALTREHLAKLLEISSDPQAPAASEDKMGHWTPADGAAALRHQLQAPLLPDLANVPGVDPTWLQSRLGEAQNKSFLALLTDQVSNVEVLETLKLWARQVLLEPANPLWGAPATVLYYAAIAAALVQAGRRITSLTEDQLCDGFAWARQQSGAKALQALFDSALVNLGKINH